ncbi:thioredoxin domain-containing protein [Candidatus Kaiserbacteria bacterium]|nr:thioredoxin domain-containing protein [Candidatus Kaiserbacteria bacterium]
METNDTNSKFLPLAVVAAGVLIAGAVVWNGSRSPTGSAGSLPAGGGAAPSVAVDSKNVNTSGRPFIGQEDAPAAILAWGDFQCPFCKRWETETLPLIMEEYVEKGKVKIVYLDFAFLGPDSTTAGEYNRAIWKLYPDKYEEWRAAMYKAQDEEHGGFGNAASIDELNASISGIDAAKVAADVRANASAYQALLDADKAEAQKVGIGATPSFVIGTQVIQGAYPYPNFKTAIDAALK